MHATLVVVDTLVVGVLDTVDTMEDLLLWVVVGYEQVGCMVFEQDSSFSSVFVAPKVFVATCNLWMIRVLHVAVDTR